VHTRSSIDQQGEGSARVPVACLLLSLPLHGPLMAAAVERTHCWRRRRRERRERFVRAAARGACSVSECVWTVDGWWRSLFSRQISLLTGEAERRRICVHVLLPLPVATCSRLLKRIGS
jgi:hypothetical protein